MPSVSAQAVVGCCVESCSCRLFPYLPTPTSPCSQTGNHFSGLMQQENYPSGVKKPPTLKYLSLWVNQATGSCQFSLSREEDGMWGGHPCQSQPAAVVDERQCHPILPQMCHGVGCACASVFFHCRPGPECLHNGETL